MKKKKFWICNYYTIKVNKIKQIKKNKIKLFKIMIKLEKNKVKFIKNFKKLMKKSNNFLQRNYSIILKIIIICKNI